MGLVSGQAVLTAAFGGLATPPRLVAFDMSSRFNAEFEITYTLRGQEVKKKVYRFASEQALASASRSKNSPRDIFSYRRM